jgi:hypothetical protein
MNRPHLLPSVPLMLLAPLVLMLGACVPGDRPGAAASQPGGEAAEKPPEKAADKPTVGGRIILFAPIALGPLGEIYAEGNLDYARKAAIYVSVLVGDAAGQVSSRLPDGASPDWKQGLVPAARGAHLVVLTSVLDLHRAAGVPDSHGPNDQAVALVEMRGLDRNGVMVFSKKANGEAAVVRSPKFGGDANAPESLATWQAISTCLGSLRTFLRDQQDLPASTDIEVIIESTPPGADVLVDGAFIGNTPITIKLPPRLLTLSLEKAACKPWSRKLTPVAGMHIQPVLEPGGKAVPAPSQPSAPQPSAPQPSAPQPSAP